MYPLVILRQSIIKPYVPGFIVTVLSHFVLGFLFSRRIDGLAESPGNVKPKLVAIINVINAGQKTLSSVAASRKIIIRLLMTITTSKAFLTSAKARYRQTAILDAIHSHEKAAVVLPYSGM